MGVSILISAMVPITMPRSALLLPVGVVALLAGRSRRPFSTTPVRNDAPRPRLGRRVGAGMYTATAVGPVLSGVLLLVLPGILVAMDAMDMRDVGRLGLSGAVFTGVGALVARYGRRVGRVSASELLRADDRSPVLFLRAFADDRLRIRSARMARSSVLERLSPRGFDRFEEVLTRFLGIVGPVIAVNPPQVDLAPLGAARDTLSEGAWHAEIRAYLMSAALVVVGLPPAERTDGIDWEVRALDQLGCWPRTTLVLPPRPQDEVRSRWAAFAGSLAGTEMANWSIGVDAGRTLAVVGSPENGRTGITADLRDTWHYRAALEAASDPARAGPAR